MVAGWVKRKIKNSDKWVRRWLEISKYVLYSYQACPAEVPQARVMNTLDLRKTKEIKLQPDESMPGLFVIVPETSDDSHPGYVMRAENDAMAQAWVQGLRKAREDELAALAVTRNPPVPPIPEFFVLMEQCQREKLSSWRTLEALVDKVTDPLALQIYYTAASAAYKLGDITKEERDTYIRNVLEIIPEKFTFDQDAHVVAMVKLVIEKARADGVLQGHLALRLDQLVENAHTFTDARFTGMVGHLEKLQLRVNCIQDELGYIIYRLHQVENRMTNVEGRITNVEGRIEDTENAIKEVRHYAEHIDANLVKLKKQLRTHFKRKAAASSASAFLNIVTLGMASGIGSTVSALCDSVFSKVVDFTDTKHVFKAIRSQNNSSPAGAELAQAFTQEKIEAWIDKPLAEIIQEPETYPEFSHNPGFIQVAAIIQTCAYIDAPIADAADASAYEIMTPALFAAALSDDASNLPPPPPASTVPTAATLGDAKTTFTQLKEDLDLDDDVKEISVDDDFMVTLQCLFNTNFTDISPDAENICRNLIDAKGKGSIKYINWKLFYDTWSCSGLSMPEYLQSKNT